VIVSTKIGDDTTRRRAEYFGEIEPLKVTSQRISAAPHRNNNNNFGHCEVIDCVIA
jgi:hypothetical protein